MIGDSRPVGTLACALLASVAGGQDERGLEELLAAHTHVLELVEGHLEGPGAELLREAVAGTQFVVVGEQHLVREIPPFLAALFLLLQEQEGYEYLALESDPLSASLASTGALRGDLDAIVAYARRYPFAFTFPSEQELALIAEVGRLSRGQGEPVWGVDQAFGAAHALAWLLERTEDESARAALEGLLEQVAAAEAERSEDSDHFLSARGKPAEFHALRELVPAEPGSEEAFCVEQLLLSDAIYRPYTDRAYGARPGAFYESGREREQNMKRLFTRRYRQAQAAGDALPKVLVKTGHWHAAYGRYPLSRVLTLGNFVHELSTSNDLGSFSIGVVVHGPPGHWREIRGSAGWERVADAADPEAWTLFDLRPLRSHEQVVRAASPQLADFLWQFDAVLLLGGSQPATFPSPLPPSREHRAFRGAGRTTGWGSASTTSSTPSSRRGRS